MKILLLIENDERQELNIQCCVQGFSASETKERWTDLIGSVDKFLSQEQREETETLPIRRGVCF
jgi:hypothetical protein